MPRRMRTLVALVLLHVFPGSVTADDGSRSASSKSLPNVILAMSDDQGWADTGYHGHPVLQTPHLDRMAREGLRFDRFYSSSPVCSPTRGSCLTGRHPFRYGVFHANAGGPTKPCRYVLPDEEVTLAEVLRENGYATGHFGKWHLGDLAGPKSSGPSRHGFDEWFSTVRKVATLDPDAASYFHNGKRVKGPLRGDDSKIIMDRALPFLRKAVAAKKPFLAVIWFHTPHLPIVASERHRAMYPGSKEKQADYFGALTAMDEQIGRLREELRTLGVDRDTMLWFTSDNGPEGKSHSAKSPGSAGKLRGRKRSLHEGGVRVPGLLVWPARIKTARSTSVVCSTHDYLPTVLALTGLSAQLPARPLDGVDLSPLIDGKPFRRPKALPFETRGQRYSLALIDGKHKLLSTATSAAGKGAVLLYDLDADPRERNDLSKSHPEVLAAVRKKLAEWRVSCRASLAGKDYRP